MFQKNHRADIIIEAFGERGSVCFTVIIFFFPNFNFFGENEKRKKKKKEKRKKKKKEKKEKIGKVEKKKREKYQFQIINFPLLLNIQTHVFVFVGTTSKATITVKGVLFFCCF